jgi:hypothetical protein
MYDKHERTRRKDRHPVAVDAEIHRTDGSKLSATLTDFSDDGCCIEGTNDFRIGERLRIAIPRMGQVRAQVRWSLPTSAGAKFVVESDF